MTDYRLNQLDREIFLTGSMAAERLDLIVAMVEDYFLEKLPDDGPFSYRKDWLVKELTRGKEDAQRFKTARQDLMNYIHLKAFPAMGVA